jgi:hypothetical protein
MHLSRIDLEKLVVSEPPECRILHSHLQECRSCQFELAAALDRERIETSIEATRGCLKVLDPPAEVRRAPIQILVFSSTGLHARLSRPIDLGALIHLRSPAGSILGHIKYCFPVEADFQIGVKVQTERCAGI